ncbi:MAG: YkgJ family cysteine cluster protein [Pikeienuella sp.]
MRAASPAEALCLSCGLCCDGSLFWAVPVGAGETVPTPLDAEGRLRQPCACFDGACTIYAQRPAACRSFDCRVLQTVQAGRRDIAWAEGEIRAMRKILAELDILLPGGAPSIYRRAAEFLAKHQNEIETAAFQRRHRRLLACLSDYEAALARFHVAAGGSGGSRS